MNAQEAERWSEPVYMDASALVKLFVPEPESDDLNRALAGLTDVIVSDRPLKRVGEPTDIAEAVRFLAGPESSWVTGQSIAVDGGTELTKAPSYLEAVTRRRVGDAVVDAAKRGDNGRSARPSIAPVVTGRGHRRT